MTNLEAFIVSFVTIMLMGGAFFVGHSRGYEAGRWDCRQGQQEQLDAITRHTQALVDRCLLAADYAE